MIDERRALEAAEEALRAWGRAGAPRLVPIAGGWRAAPTDGAETSAAGSSHALVRAVDGAVVRCPAGASDRVAEQLLGAAAPLG